MSAGDQHQRGVIGEAEHAHLIEPVMVHDRKGWHRVWRVTRLGLLILLGLAVVAFAILWIWRKPIAENVIADELERRGGQATYTLSKSRDDTTATSGSPTVAQDDQNLGAEWGLSNFDRRHQFNGTASIELPFGRNRHWLNTGGWVADVAGDWTLSATLTAQSGTPLTIRCASCAADVAQGVVGTLRADYNGLPIALPNPTANEFFNIAAFSVPAAGTFGTSGRNIVIGPGSHLLNAQLTRDLNLGNNSGRYLVEWFNPRTGGSLLYTKTIVGSGVR